MKRLTNAQRLKYLNAVAAHLVECGYHVEHPDATNDYLDVWGTNKGRRCFEEIYVTMYPCDHGISGIWYFGDLEDGTEMFLSNDDTYGLDTRWSIETQLANGLKPFKKGKLK